MRPPAVQRDKLGLRAKLVRVYALQVLLISLAALLGVYVTYVIVEDVLTKQALNAEAEHYWQLLAENPEQPLPDTANMKGYLNTRPPMPAALAELKPGISRVSSLPGAPLVHVSNREQQNLYLVFAYDQVTSLVFYFGLAPLAAVLLSVYALLFLTYRLSHQAISPMLNLARSLETFDFRSTAKLDIPVQPDDVDNETRLMVEALQEFSDRLDQFIERERTFTRDAGHELRTPMAVMRGSLEVLTQRPNLTKEDQQVVTRMQNTMVDMQTLLETLLMLAREEDVLSDDAVNMNHVISEEIELHAELAEQHKNVVIFEEHADHHCHAKEKVLGIVVGNLLRNALTYTHNGRITIRLEDRVLSVTDTGIGMDAPDQNQVFSAFYRGDAAKRLAQGQGLGLALVRRLVRQLDWRVEVESKLGVGTTFTIFYKP